MAEGLQGRRAGRRVSGYKEEAGAWTVHHPVFECDPYHPAVYRWSPWAGLRTFAYDYLCCMKPRLIVELGVHYGCSAFAFMQAMKDHSLPSELILIDTWEGDAFTAHDYEEDIHGVFCRVQKSCYPNVDAHRMRMTFDEAAGHFSDGRIDLLHIDGSHTYEDVKHDFETWLPKMREGGVIFMHDTGEDLFDGAPMGSHIFWKEMQEEYPWSLMLPFSNGLGIRCGDRKTYGKLKKMIPFAEYQRQVNLKDTENKAELRELSYRYREALKYQRMLEAEKEAITGDAHKTA